MAFAQVQTLVGDVASGVGEVGYGTTGDKFYFVSRTGGNKIYEYDPITNTETMVIQQSTLTAIKPNSDVPCTWAAFASTPIGLGGFLYFMSNDTVLDKVYIWRFTPGTAALVVEYEITVPSGGSFGTPLLWASTFKGIVFTYGHDPGGYATFFKPSVSAGFRQASAISGLGGVVDINGQSNNPDTRYPEPFYTTATQTAVVHLLRWTGSSWLDVDPSYTGDPTILYGPSHYWSIFPGIPASKGTWTDDFSTFTAVIGAQSILGGRFLNMPWEVGHDAIGNYYRYNSSINEWVSWCTGPVHAPGNADQFIMWKADDGDMYLIYAPFLDDWRVAKLTAGTCLNPPRSGWDTSEGDSLPGLHTASVNFASLSTDQLLSHVRELNQFGATPYQRNFQVSATDASIYLGNQIGADNQQVGRLQPPYIGPSSSLDDDEDLTDSISSDDVLGVDLTDAI